MQAPSPRPPAGLAFESQTHRLARFGPRLVFAVAFGLASLLSNALPLPSAGSPVLAAGDPVVAAAGDIACDPANSSFNGGNGGATACLASKTAALLVNGGYSAVLSLGDNQYFCGSLAAFQGSYAKSWGQVKSIIHPAPGDHEYITSGGAGTTGCTSSNSGAAGYFSYFGSAAGTKGQGWYSFDVGAWHLIALNSQCSHAGGCDSGSPQGKWLRADLAAHPNQCLLAYWHIPLFSSGGRANSNSLPFWQILYAAHADVVLDGHDHIYERFSPQTPNGAVDAAHGITQFTVGTGGANHTSIAAVAANSVVRDTSSFGVLALTLHQTSYSWQFIHATGSFTDSGSATCHNASGSTPVGTPVSTVPPVTGGGSASTYLALTPTRLLDSRYGTGLSGAFASGVARTFAVAGQGGVPSGASAVTGNLTVTGQSSPGYIYLGPNPTNNPSSSTLNFPTGDDRANAVSVALGSGGTLSATYVSSVSGSVANVIFDVTGYYIPGSSGSTYFALNPARILDSRYGTGLSGAFASGVARTFAVAGQAGVPANATAVTGNLTVTGQSGPGYIYLGPNPTNNPSSSTLNFPTGDDRANAACVALGSGGTLSATYVSPVGGSVANVIFDVTGYYVAGTSGAKYVPLNPARILDSRYGTGLSGAFASGVARTFAVAGHGGVPSGAIAVTGNLTVTGQSSLGYIYLGPNPTNSPTSSTLNFPTGDDRANAACVALGSGGTLSATYVSPVSGSVASVIFDVSGYFAP